MLKGIDHERLYERDTTSIIKHIRYGKI